MKPIQRHAPSRTFHHGNLTGYVIGFELWILLTLLSFGVAMSCRVAHGAAMAAIVVAQLLVQRVFFLHLRNASDPRSNTGIFLCTALLIAILVAGSLWVTHDADADMMPTRMSVQRRSPRLIRRATR